MDKMIISRLEKYEQECVDSPLFIDDENTNAYFMILLHRTESIMERAYSHVETNSFETLLAWVKIHMADALMRYDSSLVNYYFERKLKKMIDVYIFGAVLACILLDIASGYVAALKNNEVSSSVMREGLFKKCGSLLLMIAAVIVEHIGAYVGIDDAITTAITYGVGGMIVIMELTSFAENVCKINPDLQIKRIFALFGIDESDDVATYPSFECPYLSKAVAYETKDNDDVCISD